MANEENCLGTTIDANEISTEKPSLLLLNDNCLLKVIELLKLYDCVNLSNTCYRLGVLCDVFCAKKYKKTKVQSRLPRESKRFESCSKYKKFASAFTMIGEHIISCDVINGNDCILEIVKDKCKNLNSLKLARCNAPKKFGFRNLTELKLQGVEMSLNEWKNCFELNPNMESIEYDGKYDKGFFIALLEMLPNLRSLQLKIQGSFDLNQHFQYLLLLDALTKFSFRRIQSCNQLLIGLAKKQNLVELSFDSDLNADTFNIINSFQNLEVLSVVGACWKKVQLLETSVFPFSLKRMKLNNFKISCTTFLTIVRRLKFLQEFDLSSYGCIFWDHNECMLTHPCHVSQSNIEFVCFLFQLYIFPTINVLVA